VDRLCVVPVVKMQAPQVSAYAGSEKQVNEVSRLSRRRETCRVNGR